MPMNNNCCLRAQPGIWRNVHIPLYQILSPLSHFYPFHKSNGGISRAHPLHEHIDETPGATRVWIRSPKHFDTSPIPLRFHFRHHLHQEHVGKFSRLRESQWAQIIVTASVLETLFGRSRMTYETMLFERTDTHRMRTHTTVSCLKLYEKRASSCSHLL